MTELLDKKLIEAALAGSGLQDYFSFELSGMVRLFSARAGEFVFKEGERVDWLLYMIKGRAKISCSLANGRVALLDFPAAPCFFGEIELVGGYGGALEIKCLEDSVLLGLSVTEHRERILNDNRFLRYICRYVAQKETKRVAELTNIQAFPLKNRLADYILKCSVRNIYRERKTDAADYLGVSYRHLQQVMGEFVKNGLLYKEGLVYTITDRPALLRLCSEINRVRK